MSDTTNNVEIKKRVDILCHCGERHPILEWLPWAHYVAVPMIECRDATPGNILLIDTRYSIVDGEYAFPEYRGYLWVRGRV